MMYSGTIEIRQYAQHSTYITYLLEEDEVVHIREFQDYDKAYLWVLLWVDTEDRTLH